jgi:hypothetical protein
MSFIARFPFGSARFPWCTFGLHSAALDSTELAEVTVEARYLRFAPASTRQSWPHSYPVPETPGR